MDRQVVGTGRLRVTWMFHQSVPYWEVHITVTKLVDKANREPHTTVGA